MLQAARLRILRPCPDLQPQASAKPGGSLLGLRARRGHRSGWSISASAFWKAELDIRAGHVVSRDSCYGCEAAAELGQNVSNRSWEPSFWWCIQAWSPSTPSQQVAHFCPLLCAAAQLQDGGGGHFSKPRQPFRARNFVKAEGGPTELKERCCATFL